MKQMSDRWSQTLRWSTALHLQAKWRRWSMIISSVKIKRRISKNPWKRNTWNFQFVISRHWCVKLSKLSLFELSLKWDSTTFAFLKFPCLSNVLYFDFILRPCLFSLLCLTRRCIGVDGELVAPLFPGFHIPPMRGAASVHGWIYIVLFYHQQ